MKPLISMKARIQTLVVKVIAVVMAGGMAASGYAADPKADTSPATNDVPVKAAVKKQLSGAELYSIHCNRCHAERYPTERTAAQWKTIMLHMQVRANIPGNQARQILKYLQENSGR